MMIASREPDAASIAASPASSQPELRGCPPRKETTYD
jgi:hypothetical protein